MGERRGKIKTKLSDQPVTRAVEATLVTETSSSTMARVGNVFVCGSSVNGRFEEVANLKGQHVVQLCGGYGQALAITDGSKLQWISEAPDEAPTIQAMATDMHATEISFGAAHGVMRTDDGSVYAWGEGQEGQLGLGSLEPSDEPELLTRLQDRVVEHVVAGDAHNLAVTTLGEVYSWGRSYEGQTGHGFKSAKAAEIAQIDGEVQLVPRFVPGFLKTAVQRVACGFRFSVAVTREGALYSWGEGGAGQLGIGRTTRCAVPTLVMRESGDGAPFTDVACGWGHALAMATNGSVYTWGFNAKGQVGVGDDVTRFTPNLLQEQDLEANAKARDDALEQRRAESRMRRKRQAQEAEEERKKAAESSVMLPSASAPALGAAEGKASEAAAPPDRKLTRGSGSVADMSKAGWLAGTIQDSLKVAKQDADDEIHGDKYARKKKARGPDPSELRPAPKWSFPEKVFRASQIAAGLFHSAAISRDGQLWTWGCSEDNRLGLPDADVFITTELDVGMSTKKRIHVLYPARVTRLDGRMVASVTCSDRDTIALAAVQLASSAPTNGPTAGGTRLALMGGGLEALAYRDLEAGNAFDRGEIDADTPIPGVYVRFTRKSRLPDPEDEEPDDAGEGGGDGAAGDGGGGAEGKASEAPGAAESKGAGADGKTGESKGADGAPRSEGGGGGDGGDDDDDEAEEIPEELFEKVVTVPALRSKSKNGLECLSPAFPTACEVQVEVVLVASGNMVSTADRVGPDGSIDGDVDGEVVSGFVTFDYYVPPILTGLSPAAFPMQAGFTCTLEGDGLFGCMVADPAAGEPARAMIAEVEAEYEADVQAKEDEEAAERARREAEATGAATPKKGKKVKPMTAAARKKADEERKIKAAEDAAKRDKAAEPTVGQTLRVLVTLLCNGEECGASKVVPGTYIGTYAAPPPKDDDASDAGSVASDAEDDFDGPQGTYDCKIQFESPDIPLPESVSKLAAEGDVALALRVAIAPNTVNFVDCPELITTFCPEFTGMTPSQLPIRGGSALTFSGAGFVDLPGVGIKVTGEKCEVTAKAQFVDSHTITATCPKLQLPPKAVLDEESGKRKNVRPKVGKGEFRFAVTLDGTTYHEHESLGGVLGFGAKFAERLSPSCGVKDGGTRVLLQAMYREAAENAFWFDASAISASLMADEGDFKSRVKCQLDKGSDGVVFKMPTFKDPEPPVAAAGGDEGKDGDGKVGDAAEAEGKGEDGGEGDGEAAPPPAINRSVKLQFSLNGVDKEGGDLGFVYYDPSTVTVTQVVQESGKKIVAGGGVIVSVTGLEHADERELALRLRIGEEKADDPDAPQPIVETIKVAAGGAVVSDEKDSITIPALPESLPGGSEVACQLTIDGQFFSDAFTFKIA